MYKALFLRCDVRLPYRVGWNFFLRNQGYGHEYAKYYKFYYYVLIISLVCLYSKEYDINCFLIRFMHSLPHINFYLEFIMMRLRLGSRFVPGREAKFHDHY